MLRSIILSAVMLTGYIGQSGAADLVVHITGAKSTDGQFLVSIFDSAEAWMKQPLANRTLAMSSEGVAITTFDLAPGTYAIALVHDANTNGEMDTNLLGIPTEAFGFSNQVRARFGPPAFSAASFELDESGVRLTVSLNRTD